MEKREGWHTAIKDRWIRPRDLTKPIEGYRDIKCLVGLRHLPHLCFQICGLSCARTCDRYGDSYCEGCPCLKVENGGNNA